eukprot:COSAG02_NODE_67788_length_252_cov_0.673203_1_plen_49_part_10
MNLPTPLAAETWEFMSKFTPARNSRLVHILESYHATVHFITDAHPWFIV